MDLESPIIVYDTEEEGLEFVLSKGRSGNRGFELGYIISAFHISRTCLNNNSSTQCHCPLMVSILKVSCPYSSKNRSMLYVNDFHFSIKKNCIQTKITGICC